MFIDSRLDRDHHKGGYCEMNKELKQRIIDFLSDLDDDEISPEAAGEAQAIYKLLTRSPGRQKGSKKKEVYRVEGPVIDDMELPLDNTPKT